MKTLLKILGGILALIIVALIALSIWLDSAENRNRILQRTVEVLSEKLQTKVGIDSLDVRVFAGKVDLFNLYIEDQQQRKMLGIDTISVELDIKALINKTISVNYADVYGVEVFACKDSLGVPNYQFVIDSLKTDKKKEKKKMDISFNVEKAELKRVHVIFDKFECWLGDLYLSGTQQKASVQLSDFLYKWESMTKRGKQANECFLSHAKVSATMNEDTTGTAKVLVDSIFYTSCVDAPHKRVGRPKRGYFDAGHMKVAAYAELDVPFWCKDSASVIIKHLAAYDHASGLQLDTVTLRAGVNRRQVDVKDIHLVVTESHFDIPDATIVLPDSTRQLTYSTGMIDGTVILTDIARPFAPFALKQFRMPLEVNAIMEGDTATIRFHKAHVFTKDKKFSVYADGRVTGLKHKTDLDVHFDVRNMRMTNDKVFEVIYQFPVKKFMMTQLKQLGTIGFNGNLNCYFKREQFDGILTTAAGPITLNLTVDDLNKYIHGSVRTKTFNLGKAVEMSFLGEIDCSASFDFDISKPRTALIHQRNKGKLPIGSVKAVINEAHVKKIKFKDIRANINSDGALALGEVFAPGKQVDLLCDFSFASTDSLSKMKIKPHVKIHFVENIKQKKAEKKRRKAEAAAEGTDVETVATEATDTEATETKKKKAKKQRSSIFRQNMDKE